MAPPPPALPNGNLSNGIVNNNKPANIITPPNHAGLLKEIETGNKFVSFPTKLGHTTNWSSYKFSLGISLRKVEPQQQNQRSYNQGDLMKEIREGETYY